MEPPRATGVGSQPLRIYNLRFCIVFLIFCKIGRLPRDFFEKSQIGHSLKFGQRSPIS